MGYTSKQLDSRSKRDAINLKMRASPEWRGAIQSLGLNPDGPLKLNKDQQRSVAQRFGLPEDDFHIDPAGNINDFHGWKGLPTAAKIAIGAAAVAGGWAALPGAALGMGAGSTFGGLTGAGFGAAGGAGAGNIGATSAVGGLLPNAGLPASQFMSLAAPIGGHAGAGGVMAGLTTLDKLNLGARGVNYATNLIGSRSQGKADQRAQTWAQNAYADQQKLLAEQRAEDLELNRQMVARQEARWNAQQAEIKRQSDLEDTRYAERETRLAPYRAGGLQTLARLNAASQPTVTPYQSRFMGQG